MAAGERVVVSVLPREIQELGILGGEAMTMVKIDKGIPLPPQGPAQRKYPWIEMEVGDSFVVRVGTHTARCLAGNASRKYAPKKFRHGASDGVTRIWRVV